ncbi:MAG TPA: VCBS repeat-containing protein, partial [Planctomycetota bacterium]|nr:VCBS repeat-containing protein [Planctomycetota bacterium]
MTNTPGLVLGLAGLVALLALPARVAGQAQAPLFDVATYPLPAIEYVSDIDVADVNGDGVMDIGVLCTTTSFTDVYRVLFGRGDGSFFPPVSGTLGATQVWKATLADVTGDGKADRLLVGTHDNVHVQRGLGDGQFPTLGVYPIGCAPWEVHVADLDSDSLPDLVASFGDHLSCFVGFTTYLGDGQGGFQFKSTKLAAVSVDMSALSPADLDRDGHLDLVGTSSGATLCCFFGAGDGTFGATREFATAGITADTSDVDADGWVDVVTMLSSTLVAYRGNGHDWFEQPIVSPEAPASYVWLQYEQHLELGDFNADGHTDVAGSLDGELMISLGMGTGEFETPAPQLPGLIVYKPRAADVDGDGSIDLVAAVADDSVPIVVLLNIRPAWPWTTVAPGLPPGLLAAPKLSASGSLEMGDTVTLTLQVGASGAPAVLVVGPDRINAPFKGGVLVPLPTLLLPLLLDAAGGFQLSAALPASLPSGTQL